ncbi:MAG: DUF1592 domain-containing protein [Verrucomicrobiota bacterium]
MPAVHDATALELEELPWELDAVFDAHCFDCHDDTISEGGLNLLDLAFDPTDPVNLAQWTKIHDRVAKGEMPPEQKERPSASEIEKLTGLTAQALQSAWTTRYAECGRVNGRRLNPVEYETTLRDLLAAPWLELEAIIPPDPEKGDFDNVASAQDISYVQMAQYLQAAEIAIDSAMLLRPAPVATKVRTGLSEEARYFGKGEFEGLGTGRNRIVDDWIVFLRQPNSAQAPFRIRNTSQAIPGYYQFRVRCRAVLYDHGELKRPERGHVLSIRTASKRLLGKFDVPEDFDGGIVEFTAWQNEGDLLELYAETLDDRNFKRDEPLSPYRGEGIAVQWFDIEGPFPTADCDPETTWPTESYRRLFGDLPTALWDPSSGLREPEPLHVPDLSGNKRGLRDPFQLPPEKTMVVSDDPAADAERLLRQFMRRAYRRDPDESEVERCLGFALEAIKDRACFQDVMRIAYQAVLVSPDFLVFREPVGPLDDFALASRLSYLLWRSAPDQALLETAAAGLNDPASLESAYQQLFADPKIERFFRDFTRQWLDLDKVDDTAPDRYLFPEYFCDTHLIESGVAETEATFATLVKENLPVKNLVAADFAMVNERLAQLYEIEGVRGMGLRKVSLPADSPRGGFLTQSSIMKVTANGLTTSPVIRGTWVVERILGIHPPPPPPGISAVEPDTQGATTIREILSAHSQSKGCIECHKTIDPPGFALESFDVMGGWRTNYRSFGEGEQVALRVADRPVSYKEGLPVDASGVTKDGVEFRDIHEFRDYLITQERQLARNLVERFVTFATGAVPTFADRKTIERILDENADRGYPVESLLRGVVFSELFLNK